MDVQEKFPNKIANSGLVNIDLSDWYTHGERVLYDLKDNLFQGFVLKEKDFREFVKAHDWGQYQDKYVAIMCSTEAILPTWAYILVANRLSFYAKDLVFGDLSALETLLFEKALAGLNVEQYRDQRVVIKGCSDKPIPLAAYITLTNKLSPVVKSIMYGEACSSVPIYKRKN